MEEVKRWQPDLKLAIEFIDKYVAENAIDFSGVPKVVKVFCPFAAKEYHNIIVINELVVRVTSAEPPESQRTIDVATQIAATGCTAVQFFRRKATTYYCWNREEHTLSFYEKMPTFEEWIAKLNGEDIPKLRNEYPQYIAHRIAVAKQWPHPPEQFTEMMKLFATLRTSIHEVPKFKNDMQILMLTAYRIIVLCATDSLDHELPTMIYEECVKELDLQRDDYLKHLESGFVKIKNQHLRDALKHLAFVVWQMYEYRHPDDPIRFAALRHAAKKYKCFCTVVDKLIPKE